MTVNTVNPTVDRRIEDMLSIIYVVKKKTKTTDHVLSVAYFTQVTLLSSDVLTTY